VKFLIANVRFSRGEKPRPNLICCAVVAQIFFDLDGDRGTRRRMTRRRDIDGDFQQDNRKNL
jgi:hypothetical protein